MTNITFNFFYFVRVLFPSEEDNDLVIESVFDSDCLVVGSFTSCSYSNSSVDSSDTIARGLPGAVMLL